MSITYFRTQIVLTLQYLLTKNFDKVLRQKIFHTDVSFRTVSSFMYTYRVISDLLENLTVQEGLTILDYNFSLETNYKVLFGPYGFDLNLKELYSS